MNLPDKKDNYKFDTNSNNSEFPSPVSNNAKFYQNSSNNRFVENQFPADIGKSSPHATQKCFNIIKFNRNGKKMNLGDITSSSFEHVNTIDNAVPAMVVKSASNKCVPNEYEDQLYRNALNRPLPQVPNLDDALNRVSL